MLRSIPTMRTALFSKLGPGTKLSTHTGWADLANYVLRVHLCLHLPGTAPSTNSLKTSLLTLPCSFAFHSTGIADGCCGLLVDGEVQYHKEGQIIVFDDSKPHRAFNMSELDSRIVLIMDLMRPKTVPLGTATGSHTPELDDFVSLFK
jgi:beta-hydroxylase